MSNFEQVGGHEEGIKICKGAENMLAKECRQSEIDFYEKLYAKDAEPMLVEMRQFCPKYYGICAENK